MNTEWRPRISNLRFKAGPTEDEPNLVIEPGSMNLLLGPNNSGKSLALQEIESFGRGVGADPQWRVLLDGSIHVPPTLADLFGFIEALAVPEPRSMPPDPMRSENSIVYFLPAFGMGGYASPQPVHKIDLGTDPMNVSPPVWHNADWVRSNILNPLTTRLDGQARLSMSEARDAVDLRDAPIDHMNALLRNDAMRLRLQEMARDALDGWLLIDPTRIPKLVFAVSDKKPPAGIERQITDDATEFFDQHTVPLSEFSDGVRAYVGLLAGVASLPAALVLIDEPDAFLHPPLARRLGQHLASLVEERGGQLFAATHSADFTMGCLEVSADPRIVRLSYSAGRASARVLEQQDLSELIRRPLLRSTSALRGPFHRAAVVVEGDSDRVFYEEINRRITEARDGDAIGDALFLHTQGWRTLPRVADPLSRLGVPSALILDFDALRGDRAGWQPFLRRFPHQTREAVAAERARLAAELRDAVQEGRTTDAELKAKGVSALPEDRRGAFHDLIGQLAGVGIFVVPNGEVESWLPNLGIPRRKDLWTERMLDHLGSDPSSSGYVRPGDGDVWSFLRTVGRWIQAQTP